MPSKIVMTGGGTAGHVTPNIALIEQLKADGWSIDYIGSYEGIEKGMITALAIPFHPISSGKLRRYFSWKNFTDPFKTMKGITQSYLLLRQLKPDLVFSKGGFVAFPVVVGAWLNRIPLIAHESDMSPGLANRLSYPFIDKICLTFDGGRSFFKADKKLAVTGTPIRSALFQGDKARGLALCGFHDKKPCLLVMGGSMGSTLINQCVRQALTELTARYQVIHLCGRGNVEGMRTMQPDYFQINYADDEMPDLFAASDIVLSRSGANTLYELLALEKPHVLVPLSKKASRGDQIQNARYFEKQGISVVIDEANLTNASLLRALDHIEAQKPLIVEKMKALGIGNASQRIMALIREHVKR